MAHTMTTKVGPKINLNNFHDDDDEFTKLVTWAIPALLTLHFFSFSTFILATIKHLVDQSNKFKAYDDLGVQFYITT